jgi:hypothetical protein
MPVLPIATCEIQGYTCDAKLRLAELADGPFDDPALARRLRIQAGELCERFNRDFWIDERGGFYALGLDGDKRPIDSMTSNMGQLLWSGIVPEERGATVARQLMSDDMFSGWVVRTTSAAERGYNPIGYHQGTVWPHDNSLIAHGLARYGFRAEANRIITAMLAAGRGNGPAERLTPRPGPTQPSTARSPSSACTCSSSSRSTAATCTSSASPPTPTGPGPLSKPATCSWIWARALICGGVDWSTFRRPVLTRVRIGIGGQDEVDQRSGRR